MHSHLAAEALAGLAAKEDFSHVQLKQGNTAVPNSDFVPYKKGQVMLLQVKGRRPCQVRLVRPHPSSVNSGDAYILLTPGGDVYAWCGRYANAIEKSRVSEVAQAIVTAKDLGCKAGRLTTIEEENQGLAGKKFWRALTAADDAGAVGEAGPPDEDDAYVASLNELNLVWSVDAENCQLVPVESAWGAVSCCFTTSSSEHKYVLQKSIEYS